MTFIPFEILITIFGMSFALPILGYIYRTQFPMSTMFFLAGASWLIIFLTTDSIGLGQTLIESDNTISELTTNIYNLNTHTTTISVSGFSTHARFAGEKIVNQNSSLWNQNIDRACIHISKSGSLSGSATIGVYNTVIVPTQTNYVYLIGNITNVSTIPTSFTWFCFKSPTNQEFVLDGDYTIGIFYNGGAGDSANRINLATSAGNPIDGTNTVDTRYVSSWSDFTNNDIRMIISSSDIEEITANTYSDNEYFIKNPLTLEPTLVGLILIIFSLAFIIIGVLIEVKWAT